MGIQFIDVLMVMQASYGDLVIWQTEIGNLMVKPKGENKKSVLWASKDNTFYTADKEIAKKIEDYCQHNTEIQDVVTRFYFMREEVKNSLTPEEEYAKEVSEYECGL